MCSNAATVKFDVPDNIYSNKTINGTCTVDYKGKRYNPASCKMMKVRVKPNTPNADTCIVKQLNAKNWPGSGCKADFTILCSKENVSIDLQCLQSNNNLIKKINGECILCNL